MKCIRCNIDLGRANKKNSDYVLASDFIVTEKRTRFYAIKVDKDGKTIEETRIARAEDSLALSDIDRIETRWEDALIQKTGIVCKKCYQPTDVVIWGIHKDV